MKRCSKCRKLLSESNFYKDKRTKSGLYSSCKECQLSINRKWRRVNPEKARVNSEKAKESSKKWYKANFEKAKENAEKWNKENPERMKENHKKWNKANPKKKKESIVKWQKANPEKLRMYSRKRRALENNVEGSFTIKEWERKKKEFKNCCAICGISEEELLNEIGIGLVTDHIIPLSKGGTNWIINIQPLCRSCNCKKSNKL